MIHLVSDQQILPKLKTVIHSNQPVDLAVAFAGKDVVERLASPPSTRGL